MTSLSPNAATASDLLELIDGLGSGVRAAMSLRNESRPAAFSMRRIENSHVRSNLDHFMTLAGLPRPQLVMPYTWEHSGDVAVVTQCPGGLVLDERTGSYNPKLPSPPAGCDAVVTQHPDIVLGTQGADCPPLLLHDPVTRTIGAAHCGWRPLAQHIVANTIAAFVALGARPRDIRAWVGPGAGDDAYTFETGDEASALLDEHGRWADFERHLRMRPVDGRQQPVLGLNAWVRGDLIAAGLGPDSITVDERSCINDPRLHSYRAAQRRGEPYGLGIAVIKLQSR